MKKTYPICTIRNTPEEMIHCVVWAKELLFNRMFGLADEITGKSLIKAFECTINVYVGRFG